MYYYLNYNPTFPTVNQNGLQQAAYTVLQPPNLTQLPLEENNQLLLSDVNCDPVTKSTGTQTPFVFIDEDFPIEVDPIKRVADTQTRFSQSANNSWTCFECGYLYEDEDSLWLHLAKGHNEGRYHKCKKCKQEFVRSLEFYEHRYNCSFYKQRKRCFMCCACRKRYAILKSLDVHKNFCSRKPPQNCPDSCEACNMNKYIIEKRNKIRKI